MVSTKDNSVVGYSGQVGIKRQQTKHIVKKEDQVRKRNQSAKKTQKMESTYY
jgi:hypothetical protein